VRVLHIHDNNVDRFTIFGKSMIMASPSDCQFDEEILLVLIRI
jgi:hypothetical protein